MTVDQNARLDGNAPGLRISDRQHPTGRQNNAQMTSSDLQVIAHEMQTQSRIEDG